MSDANEQTAKSPNAPTADRMAKARAAKTAKDNRIAELEAQIAALQEKAAGVQTVPEPPAARPGEYFIGGTDSAGKPVLLKRKWKRADVEKMYPPVTFAPTLSIPVSPHGVKPQWVLVPGKIVTVPSIVKDIHDAQLFSIQRQSEGYRVSDEQTKRVFDAAMNDPLKSRHFEGLKHVGYGWPMEALQAAGRGLGDSAEEMARIGWEPEVGFPGGYSGKPLPQADAKKV